MAVQPSGFVKQIEPYLNKWRRHLHQYPELGFTEYYTTSLLGEELKKLGFTVYSGREALETEARYGVPKASEIKANEKRAIENGVSEEWMDKMRDGHTGIVAVYDTEKSGSHLAFRFDIDALPIEEAEQAEHIPHKEGFGSRYKGIMHACGHDGHTTIGLGLARFIAENHEHLKGRFTLLFQPAEEGGRGARAMTEKGWLQGVDEFYSGHIGINSLPVGTIAATTRGFLASSKLNVYFKGQSSHSGMKPEAGRNALLAAATAATQLHGISRHSDGISRVNVGKLIAGNGRNIISDRGYLELETRGENQDINQYMQTEARRIIEASALMYQVEAEVEFVGETEEVKCDESLIPSITKACESSEFITRVDPYAMVSGSEDASFMMNAVQANGGKATYMLFGTYLPDNHHSPNFDFEEEVLPVAVDAYIQIVKGVSEIG
ncbi:amidohydrolase [Halobacillus sp. A5]|uniref:amidohydrolase n=1 Tax=Halobacillus sp. A5 TaxID=2880263 RepID=UPI0020A67F1E|nr:amidohydrolase [Halobacillus sp. A5]MCP3027228.1 amidohydrolase [Halobacillus sp. A5]